MLLCFCRILLNYIERNLQFLKGSVQAGRYCLGTTQRECEEIFTLRVAFRCLYAAQLPRKYASCLDSDAQDLVLAPRHFLTTLRGYNLLLIIFYIISNGTHLLLFNARGL